MASSVLMFLEARSKYRILTDFSSHRTVLSWTFIILCVAASVDCGGASCEDLQCLHGECQNSTTQSPQEAVCVCDPGWAGTRCESCGGRIRLTEAEGVISDGAGNYTVDTKCTWLIEGEPGTVIRIRFHQFATECSWDHLYIYDGNSVYAPLIAVLSGLVIPRGSSTEWMPEIVARTGMVYLHFYSDAAYNMSGFKLKYKMGTCPLECSDQGTCSYIDGGDGTSVDGECTCNEGHTGDGCQWDYCPNNCTHGTCEGTGDSQACECGDNGYNGEDCSIPDTKGYWSHQHAEYQPPAIEDTLGRASHKSVVIEGDMWVVGGYTFGHEASQKIFMYNFANAAWSEVSHTSGQVYPSPRYGHSLVYEEPHLLMFGGLTGNTITDELWSFNVDTRKWMLMEINTIQREEGPLAVVGHTAHLIDGIMYIIFGHSPVYGYMNTVQQCNMSSIRNYLQCQIATTSGAIVKGGYGHSSIYDADQGLIYIHAGYHSMSVTSYYLTDKLYSYHPIQKTWKILTSSGQPRYLHSAVLMNGLMLVFGGNTHNDTSVSQGAKCYSVDFLAYDLDCDTWTRLDGPHVQQNVARFGHIAEVEDDMMYVFGGFNGLLLGDMYSYTPANCRAYTNREECLAAREGVLCAWANDDSCTSPADANYKLSQKTIQAVELPVCDDPDISDEDHQNMCRMFTSCPSCVENSYDCTWCNDGCTFGSCNGGATSKPPSAWNQCKTKYSSNCHLLHNCMACGTEDYCAWVHGAERMCYLDHGVHKSPSRSVSKSTATSEEEECNDPCYTRTTCENCTQSKCMWCSSEQRCVESNSYIASFPYGQCMEWTTMDSKCAATRCSGLRTCEECQENPSCGWCDDSSNTGLGSCIEGGLDSPVELTEDGEAVEKPDMCPGPRWYFLECPLCQCNGHSTCHSETSECMECEDLTTGPQCQHCQDGYFGDATNGGNCTACECNNQADHCDRQSGKCYCRTKGVIGDGCDRCDESRKYFGDPAGGGTCYYSLTTDYQFTFNLSQKDDKYYTQINFMNTPTTSDKNADFSINCSGKAYINITVRSKEEPEERLLVEHEECTNMKREFSHKEFKFGREHNTTFFVYVYGFTTPFSLQISFSQFPHIDLLQFFVTFFSCFLSLLLIAAIFWKLKQKYDMCRRRQMMEVEMEQRASRPFATCGLTVEDPSVTVSLMQRKDQAEVPGRPVSKKKKLPTKPSPISLEPLHNQKAAILSLVVRLPCGDEDYTPPGQSGFIIGSALVSLGNPRKASMDHSKVDKAERRKQASAQHAVANCV